MHNIKIGKYEIGVGKPPFIIAEMSGNHNQSLERALAIVAAAAKAGVSAIKIQTYTADTMTIKSGKKDFSIRDSKSLWNGRNLYDLYKEAYTPWEWHKPIFDKCKKLGIIGFSTPYDETAVDYLESLKVPLYKIASFELVDIPLIKKVASTGKPIIISIGMATAQEIGEAVSAAKKAGCKDLVLLKCTSSYPSSPKDSNLVTMLDMKKRFNCHVGLSDHTLGIGSAIAGVVLGAEVIEKHFTIKRADGGVDSAFSMEPEEMKMLVEESTKAHLSLGKVKYGPTQQEKRSLIFRRSLYAVEDIKKGQEFTKSNVRSIRPGKGLAPKYLERILGKKSAFNIKKGTPLNKRLAGL